jgi:hypothetical protein
MLHGAESVGVGTNHDGVRARRTGMHHGCIKREPPEVEATSPSSHEGDSIQ